MILSEFLQQIKTTTGHEPRKSGKDYACRCPAHDDRTASLSVGQGDNGGITVHCFAGCSTESVLQAMGLTMADLMPGDNGHAAPAAVTKPKRTWPTADSAIKAVTPPGHKVGGTYVYRDNLRCDYAAVARYDGPGGKTIRPFTHLSAGGWACGDPPRWTPYRIDEAAACETVFVTEGEKCCDQGWMIGLPCVTSAHGSQAAAKTDWTGLRGRNVVILPDNDAPGEKYAADVAGILRGLGCRVKIVRLPGLPEHGDIVDWLRAIPDDGLSPEQIGENICAMADRAMEWQPAAACQEPPGSPADDAIMVCAANVQQKKIDWLWRNRIPVGMLTLLSSRPGLGKTLIACAIAASITMGREFPDGERSDLGSVVFLDAENPTDTILVPRLQAAGCDLTRVHIITGRTTKAEDGKTVPAGITLADLPTIDRAIARVPDCRLLIVDPVGSYLGARTDSHRDNEVRAVLQPIADLALRRQIAVLMIAHHRKQDSGFADDLVLGSRAFTGLCRISWHVSQDETDKSLMLLILLC